MNTEKMQLKELLTKTKKCFMTLDTEASALILLIRTFLSPYEKITKLNMHKITFLTKRLDKTAAEMKTLTEEISKLEAELE